MELKDILTTSPADLEKASRYLDELEHAHRVEQIRKLPRKLFAHWFHSSQGFLPLSVDELVPADGSTLRPMRHFGTNNMPMFRRFEKPMYRQTDGVVAGRNVQTWEWLTGPGYFTVNPGEGGDVVFDYVALPNEAPEGWPKIKSNAHGFSYFVFRGMTDVVRRVSKHVVIGEAARHGKPINQYFVLVSDA